MQQIDYSANAMLMLNASCQSIVEIYIEPSPDQWYEILENELWTAQKLVRAWRTSGALYFNDYILSTAISCGHNFSQYRSQINGWFDQLIRAPDAATRNLLIEALNNIKSPVIAMDANINLYEEKLKEWGGKMQAAFNDMNLTVKQIQNQEADLKSQIDAINDTITSLQKQIQTDRDAITKAEAAEDRGKLETIFGIIFAPFTGGLSLILAGIGVASIADAESQISSMQASISDYQAKITGDQHTMSDDQKQIATLHGLTMSLGTCLDDMAAISTSLDSLRLMWQDYIGNLEDEIKKLGSAQDAQVYVIGRAWFNAACDEWDKVIPASQDIKDGPLTTTRITI